MHWLDKQLVFEIGLHAECTLWIAATPSVRVRLDLCMSVDISALHAVKLLL